MSDIEDKFSNLYYLIQYRRRDDGIRWINMAAFDTSLSAERYFEMQRCDDDWPWEYQLVDLESGVVTRQNSPQASATAPETE